MLWARNALVAAIAAVFGWLTGYVALDGWVASIPGAVVLVSIAAGPAAVVGGLIGLVGVAVPERRRWALHVVTSLLVAAWSAWFGGIDWNGV